MKASELKQLLEPLVRKIVKEELKEIHNALLEQKKITDPLRKVGGFTAPTYPEPISKSIPTHTERNTHTQYQSTGNSMIDLLNETKQTMTGDDWSNLGNFSSENINNFRGFVHGNEPVVGTVNDMLGNSSKNAYDINQVEIDVVPNFSKIMGVMKEQGKI